MMDAVVPMCCSARTASFNQVFSLRWRAIETDPTFAKGFSDPPIAGFKTFAAIYAGWGFSEPFYRTEGYRVFGAKAEQFVEYFWEPPCIHHDANNLLALLWTWMNGDVSDTPAYGGDFAKAPAAASRRRRYILPGQTDSYFPPVDSRHEASLIPGGVCARGAGLCATAVSMSGRRCTRTAATSCPDLAHGKGLWSGSSDRASIACTPLLPSTV